MDWLSTSTAEAAKLAEKLQEFSACSAVDVFVNDLRAL